VVLLLALVVLAQRLFVRPTHRTQKDQGGPVIVRKMLLPALWCLLAGFTAAPTAAAASDDPACRAQTPASVAACTRLARQDDPDGLYGLGMLYYEGIGVAVDYERSLHLVLKAAYLGNVYAQLQAGQAYANGQGTRQNFEEAYAWLLVARENGNSVAQQGLDVLDSRGAIPNSRRNQVVRRANEIYSEINDKRGFRYDEEQSEMPTSGLSEYCDLVMPTVESIIQLKRHDRPRSTAEQLMVGMTDPRAIAMMEGVIEWVWSSRVPDNDKRTVFKRMCLQKSPEVAFIFPG